MDAKLVVVGGDAKAAEINLKLPTIIGRGRSASLTLRHPLVSRQHCEIYEQNGRLMVRDLGSLNGTFINNERVTEAVLPAGELLTVGTVTFRAVYDSQPAGPPTDSHTDQPSPSQDDVAAEANDPTVRASEMTAQFISQQTTEDELRFRELQEAAAGDKAMLDEALLDEAILAEGSLDDVEILDVIEADDLPEGEPNADEHLSHEHLPDDADSKDDDLSTFLRGLQ
jgi:predicted component of type VI protein secretion system